MDREVIEQKLASLQRCIERINGNMPADASNPETDFDKQDIVSLNLSRAVQLTVDMGAHLLSQQQSASPASMGQTFELLAQAGLLEQHLAERLKKSVGFRNIAVQSYEKINWAIVHSIVKNHLGDFSEFARIVANQLEAG
jgi:uncharacterized protein YutE (UPF0331/DUF86 family)